MNPRSPDDDDDHHQQTFQLALQTATDKFAWCLSHGANASAPLGMVCNRGTNYTEPDAQATVTSTSSRGMTGTEAAANVKSGSGVVSGNGAAGPVQTGNVKAVGLVGGLLLVAGAFGAAL